MWNPAALPKYKRHKNVLLMPFVKPRKNCYTDNILFTRFRFKKTWKVCNKIQKPNCKSKITLEINFELTSNPNAASNYFNGYFSCVASI